MGVKAAGSSLRAALSVILLSHIASFLVLLTLATSLHVPFPHGAPLFWGLLAGVTGGLALLAFYTALARGAMGAAAAISGLLAAAIPAGVSAIVEGAPGWPHLAGFLIAGLAIWLIGGGSSEKADRSAALLAIAAGAGFGLYFVALRYASPAGVLWPMATARVGSITTCALLLLALHRAQPRTPRPAQGRRAITQSVLLWALSTAFFDTSGNLMFVAATRAGRLDVAAVLASLYPASTILLAAVVLREHPSRRQAVGMSIALAAVVLVAL